MERELPMSDADIIREYRESKDQYAQITILADLNITTRDRIKQILKDAGISPTRPAPLPKTVWTDAQRRAIYEMQDAGMNSTEIARRIGSSATSVAGVIRGRKSYERKNPRTENHHRPGKKKNET